MEVESFQKGSTVEVCSDDVGFHGAWYVATLEDIKETTPATPTKTRASKKKNRKKIIEYVVKYATLFKEDNSKELLTEKVDPRYVRPIPPRNPSRNDDNQDGAEAENATEEVAGDFQVNDVVDAYLRDGWWIGVVSKVIIVDGELKKYLVSFETPLEIVFEGSQMRLHVDWIDSSWKLRPQKTAESNNEATNGAHSGLITPPKGALTTDSANRTAWRKITSKKKHHLRKEAVTNDEGDGVVVDRSVKHRRTKRTVALVEGEDVHEILQSSVGLENSGSNGNTGDPLRSEQELINKETCETQDGNSQPKRKRGRASNLLFQSPNGSLEDNEEARKRDSSGNNDASTEIDDQPLSVWCRGLNPLLNNKKSSRNTALDHDEPIAASNPDMVNEGQTTENDHVWPFTKRSPVWSTIESLELFQNLSQNPHFSPLRKVKEDYREGYAIALMVTFTNVVHHTTNLQWADPNDAIKDSLETLKDLEANGFDVGPVRARLDELLAKKDEAGRLEGEIKEAEEQVEKCNREKTAIDEEINTLERKMKEVEEKMVKALAMKNMKDVEDLVVRSELQDFSKRIADWKLAFQELVGSPL